MVRVIAAKRVQASITNDRQQRNRSPEHRVHSDFTPKSNHSRSSNFVFRFIPTAANLFETGTTSSMHAAESTGIPLVVVHFPSIRSGTSSLRSYEDNLQGGYADLGTESGTPGDGPRPHTQPLAPARVRIGAYRDPHCSTTDRPTDAVTVGVTVPITAAVVVPAQNVPAVPTIVTTSVVPSPAVGPPPRWSAFLLSDCYPRRRPSASIAPSAPIVVARAVVAHLSTLEHPLMIFFPPWN